MQIYKNIYKDKIVSKTPLTKKSIATNSRWVLARSRAEFKPLMKFIVDSNNNVRLQQSCYHFDRCY